MKLLKEEAGGAAFILAFFFGSAAITLPSVFIHDSEVVGRVTWIVCAVYILVVIVSFGLFGYNDTKSDLE